MVNHNYITLNDLESVPTPFKDIYEYWKTQKNSGFAPKWANFHLDKLPFSLLPWVVVVDVETDPPDYLYRYWGTSRANLIGRDMTGFRASEIANAFIRSCNIQEYETVCQEKAALLCVTPTVKESGLQATFQSIRLPLSDDGTHVTKIISAMNHTAITRDHHQIYGTENRPVLGGVKQP